MAKRYDRIEGWLVIPGLGLIVAPIVLLLGVYQTRSAGGEIPAYAYQQIAPLLNFQLISNVVNLILIIVVAVPFFQRRRVAPKLMIALMIFALLLSITNYFIADSIPVVSRDYLRETGGRLSLQVLLVLIWLPYFLWSKRVAYTFVLAGSWDSRRDLLIVEAANRGDTDIVQTVVKNGANLNVQDEKGITALMSAARWGRTGVVKDLLRAGANVNVKSKDGSTALMQAAFYGDADSVSELLRAGADRESKDNEGKTAMNWARGQESILKRLSAAS